MDLPNDLPGRYSRMTDEGSGADVPAASVAPIPATQLNTTVDRPGFIQWNNADDDGVSFNLRPTKAQLKADELDVAAMVRGGYVKMGDDGDKKISPAPVPQMDGYYTRGIGDDAGAAAVAATAAPAGEAAKPEPPKQGHGAKKLLTLLVVLALGVLAGRFASRKGWL